MKMTCKKCGYEWQTKTDKAPKSCPSCKQYFDRKHVKQTDQKGEK